MDHVAIRSKSALLAVFVMRLCGDSSSNSWRFDWHVCRASVRLDYWNYCRRQRQCHHGFLGYVSDCHRRRRKRHASTAVGTVPDAVMRLILSGADATTECAIVTVAWRSSTGN